MKIYQHTIKIIRVICVYLLVFVIANDAFGGERVKENDTIVTFEDKKIEQMTRKKTLTDSKDIKLSKILNITALDLTEQGLSNINDLRHFKSLTSLILDNNEISDISALSGLTNLKELSLRFNKISDITALANLVNLKALYIDDNKVRDISALKKLSKLKILWLRYNYIDDISSLADKTNLVSLMAEMNNISDWSPVSHVDNVQGRPEKSDEQVSAENPDLRNFALSIGDKHYTVPMPVKQLLDDGWRVSTRMPFFDYVGEGYYERVFSFYFIEKENGVASAGYVVRIFEKGESLLEVTVANPGNGQEPAKAIEDCIVTGINTRTAYTSNAIKFHNLPLEKITKDFLLSACTSDNGWIHSPSTYKNVDLIDYNITKLPKNIKQTVNVYYSIKNGKAIGISIYNAEQEIQ